MRAAVFNSSSTTPGPWLSIEDIPRPQPHARPRPPPRPRLRRLPHRPSHRRARSAAPPSAHRPRPSDRRRNRRRRHRRPCPRHPRRRLLDGRRRRHCWFCRHDMENLCDNPVFTGYSVNGGYAEYALVRADFVLSPPRRSRRHLTSRRCSAPASSASAACASPASSPASASASSASAAPPRSPSPSSNPGNARSTSSPAANPTAPPPQSLGATWVGDEDDKPPVPLDRAITFAPSGKVVVSALASLRKGGVVAINAIHLDQMPAFDYDKLLWGERQIRSVANMTRQDARDFLDNRPRTQVAPRRANLLARRRQPRP